MYTYTNHKNINSKKDKRGMSKQLELSAQNQ